MTDIEKVTLDIKEELYSEECVKEYFRLKSIIENDEEINKLQEEVRVHQKAMCENMNNDEIYFKEKALYEEAHSKLDSNPIVINFNNVKEEVTNLLRMIKEAIQWF